ncbi:MAG: nitric oxide reductase activation protein NorD [Longimicrobiaceae bacterium]
MGLASLLRRAAGRGDAPAADAGVPLETVRRRLELFLAALYGRGIPIAAAEAPPTPPLLRRLLRRAPSPPRTPAASTDGARVLLPPVLGEASDALARYQLLAVEQAERLVRGTPLLAPGDDAPLERDLYLLAESAAVDASIARAAPGLVPALRRARAEALARRPSPDAVPAAEREVEALVRRVLESDPASPPADLPAAATAAGSLAWARAAAARAKSGVRGYRGVPLVEAWGSAPLLSALGTPLKPIMLDAPMGRGEADSGVIAPDAGDDSSGEMDDRPSALPDSSAGGGEQGDDAPAPGAGEEEDGPEVEGSDQPGGAEPDEDTPPPDPFGGGPKRQRVNGRRETFEYPEWDWKAARYVERASTVRVVEPQAADGAWAAEVLRAHAPMVRRLREKFERLRARRVRLTRQPEGDELDLAACVGALVDRHTGRAPDDRLYLQVRPARRGLAIALLVDISGSTDERVGRSRIIDLEKVALLLTCEALDALGDEYTVLTFSGKSAGDVRLRTLKGFGERTGEAVRGRVTALRPEGYTRLGPAVRHASALLARPGAGHRLLLILSDGRPNDVDQYSGRYGIEDSRQAVAEARKQGIFPFCITIDQKGPAYISRIFGQSGHVILRHADQLPLALSQAVRHLLGA